MLTSISTTISAEKINVTAQFRQEPLESGGEGGEDCSDSHWIPSGLDCPSPKLLKSLSGGKRLSQSSTGSPPSKLSSPADRMARLSFFDQVFKPKGDQNEGSTTDLEAKVCPAEKKTPRRIPTSGNCLSPPKTISEVTQNDPDCNCHPNKCQYCFEPSINNGHQDSKQLEPTLVRAGSNAQEEPQLKALLSMNLAGPISLDIGTFLRMRKASIDCSKPLKSSLVDSKTRCSSISTRNNSPRKVTFSPNVICIVFQDSGRQSPKKAH